MALVTLDALEVSAHGQTLVEPLSCEIPRGGRIGLIGESGSGKSLTALALMGLLPEGVTAGGTVRLEGREENLLTLSDRAHARLRGNTMSMVFQEPMTALNPLVRVGAQIREVMLIHGRADRATGWQRAVELLRRVDMPHPEEAARAYPHQLSGGQRQRVMLAMALANDPQLLICDEPTTALDVTVQAQVLSLIDEVVREDERSLLFITHDLGVVAQMCDTVLVMSRGSIVERGSVEDVFTHPQHPYTQGLLAASDLGAVDAGGRLFTIATSEHYDPAHRTPPQHASAPPEQTQPLLEVRDVRKVYEGRGGVFSRGPGVEALKGVSLSIREGGQYGIVGESGSGKTTLLKILAGLETASSGQVWVDGIDVTAGGRSELAKLHRQLQVVFQDPYGSLDPRMRVADIIAEPLHGAGLSADERRQTVAKLLDDVGLPADAAERYPHQFSGGQRQRISIARALSVRPRIIIADEPVSALDVSVRAQVLNLLSDLVDEYGLTLVFVSHDLAVVRYLCDEVAVMRRGEIIEHGSVEEIYTNPREDYTRTLIAATPDLRAALTG